jgi:hypothetical protein
MPPAAATTNLVRHHPTHFNKFLKIEAPQTPHSLSNERAILISKHNSDAARDRISNRRGSSSARVVCCQSVLEIRASEVYVACCCAAKICVGAVVKEVAGGAVVAIRKDARVTNLQYSKTMLQGQT